MEVPAVRGLMRRRQRRPARLDEPGAAPTGVAPDAAAHEGSTVSDGSVFDVVAPVANSTDLGVVPDVASEDGLSSVEQQAPTFGWASRERNSGEADPVTIGAPSTFGAADWWSSGWWPAGDARGDVHADLATRGVLAVAGVTLRGNKHRLRGEACEDAFHIRPAGTIDAPFLCLAVCDGVGSSAQSRLGAEWLSELVTEQLAEAVSASEEGPALPDAASARSAVAEAVDIARVRAESERIALSDVQTTLTFAVIPADGKADCIGIVGQIGDSPAFVWAPDGWTTVGVASDHDEPIISTRTSDAMSADASKTPVTRFELGAGGRLLICSDGVGNFIRASTGMLDLGAHLGVTLRHPVPLSELVRQADFDLRSADDDRTLVIVWRQSLDFPKK